jgi:tetratricopeptide (TPR) repeat protein
VNRDLHKKWEQKPKFFWQAALILLPVMVLAGVAFLSLRQDKRLAQSEATERAQSIADELLRQIRFLISQTSTNDDTFYVSAFQVNTAGQLLFPPPAAEWPAPQAFELSELEPEQAQTWQAARDLEVQYTNLASAEECYSKFLASKPPKRFAASGLYARASLLDRMGNTREVTESFKQIVSQYADVTGETGLPLLPLAQFRLFLLSTDRSPIAALELFYSNVVHLPNPLSSLLMSEAKQSGGAIAGIAQKWHSIWEQHERARSLYQAASGNFGANRLPSQKIKGWESLGPRLFWFEVDSEQMPESQRKANANLNKMTWLATRCQEEALSCWFVCKTDSQVYRGLQSVANDEKQIPEYFGLDLEVCGRKFVRSSADLQLWTEHHHGGKGGGWDKEYSDKTASASEVLGSAVYAEDGNDLLKVNVYLTSPATLFARQRARSFWFSVLIGTSAAAALLGLMTAWRTFNRQQQLAELKSNFVSSVSHELRAPIASVLLMAESLERGKISGSVKQQEYYQFILQECRRLSSLVENVLDFSRIEQGRKEYEFEPTDLVALTEQTVKLMEPYASERQVTLTFSLPSPRPSTLDPSSVTVAAQWRVDTHLSLDGKAIQQALVNLIDNAIKHSPKGETVVVGLEIQSVEETSVEVGHVSPCAPPGIGKSLSQGPRNGAHGSDAPYLRGSTLDSFPLRRGSG